MALKVVTPPAGPIIDDATAQLQCRVDSDDDLVLIQVARTAAEESIEEYLRRTLLQTVYDRFLPCFPQGRCAITMPAPPLVSVTHLKYYDTSGNQQTLSEGTDYQVDTNNIPGEIVPAPGGYWPATQADKVGAVEIRFTAGYADADEIPSAIKAAILMRIAALYTNPEEYSRGVGISIHPMADLMRDLLSPYINRFAQ